MSYKIAVVGLWHLGEIYSAGLAECGHQIVGLDEDERVIKNFYKNIPPLAEPKLVELLQSNQAKGRLCYTTDFSLIKDCNVIWLALDTPVDNRDNINLAVVYNALKKSLSFLKDGVLIVISSQVPVGSSEKIKKFIFKYRPKLKFDYVYAPENLRLGEAIECFLKPDRIIIGADSEAGFNKMTEIFSSLKTKILKMSPASAEMAKHALNAFLATSLSFTYDLADICEKVGADIIAVAKALRSDSRIGSRAYLDASLGFSGGTLGRDLKILLAAAKDNSINAPVIRNVFFRNKNRKNLAAKILIKELGSLKNKHIAIFGLTYKAGTGTLRRSLALEIAKILKNKGAILKLYDSQAQRDDIESDPYKAAEGAQAVLFVTPSPGFQNFDFVQLRKAMKKPALFWDTRNFFCNEADNLRRIGFRYLGMGRQL